MYFEQKIVKNSSLYDPACLINSHRRHKVGWILIKLLNYHFLYRFKYAYHYLTWWNMKLFYANSYVGILMYLNVSMQNYYKIYERLTWHSPSRYWTEMTARLCCIHTGCSRIPIVVGTKSSIEFTDLEEHITEI